MSKSKELHLELQVQQTTRESISYEKYRQSVENAPSPKDLMNIALDAIRELMGENHISIYVQAIMMGLTIEYGNAAVQDFIHSAGNKVTEPIIDHALMLQKRDCIS